MRTLSSILILQLLFSTQIASAQIKIEDKSAKPDVKAKRFNGEFMTLENIYDEATKKGIVGEKVTTLNVRCWNFFYNEEDLKAGKSLSLDLEKWFENKTFEITDYRYEYGDILTLKSDGYKFVWKVSSLDKYVFNKFIDNLKSTYESKVFVPLHFSSSLKTLDGIETELSVNETYEVSMVKFAKLQRDYGIVFLLNNKYEYVFPTDDYTQPRVFNGFIYSTNENYINLQYDDALTTPVTFIEINEFKSFSSKNERFINEIRNKKVKIGMSKRQCYWAWGIPSRSMQNIAGYDEVLIFEGISQNQSLYFRDDTLSLIK